MAWWLYLIFIFFSLKKSTVQGIHINRDMDIDTDTDTHKHEEIIRGKNESRQESVKKRNK